MTVEMNVRFDKDQITQLSKQKNEPDWMLDLRLKAFDKYKELPLPHLDKTKIDKWNIDQFELSNPKSDLTQLSQELLDQGVIFIDLDNALQQYPDLVKKYFMNNLSFEDNKLVALHTALWNGGVFLYIPKNVEVEFPIQASYQLTDSGLLPHVIIVAEPNSSVTYVDHYFSSNVSQPTVHHGAVEIYVGENARVRFATIHNFDEKVYDYTYRQATVARNGKMEWAIGEMNEGNTVSNNTSILKGSGSFAGSKLIFIGTGEQKTNFVSKMVHEGDHTDSQIVSRGVMMEQSTAIFNGVTHIKKGAVKSNAEQTEKVLMLNEKARGDANPILLIDENDVMASHAASAGPVNPNDIYYLMSRGIPKEEAERLIIHGFLSPVVSLIPIEEMQEQLEKVIERRLEK
ncbi:MAG: Fe-S cluster assembly protein SufD [Tepidibacillus sp.]